MRISLRTAVSGLVLIASLFMMTAADAVVQAPAPVTRSMYVTLYGWPDNSPPGNSISYPRSEGYPTVHDVAGGTGTYADPVTLATDSGELPVGTIVYIPYLQKYLVNEDQCVACLSDWSHRKYHIDLWIGGQGYTVASLKPHLYELTKASAAVIVDPPANEPVNQTPLLQYSSP